MINRRTKSIIIVVISTLIILSIITLGAVIKEDALKVNFDQKIFLLHLTHLLELIGWEGICLLGQ